MQCNERLELLKPAEVAASKSNETLTSNLISESLRLDDRDVIDDSLVGVEISCEFSVVSLDDGLGRSLNSLGSDSSLKIKQATVSDESPESSMLAHAPSTHYDDRLTICYIY